MLSDVRLKCKYALVGGETATPIREFQDGAGVIWLEAIFVSGHSETLERHTKPAFLNIVLQEVR